MAETKWTKTDIKNRIREELKCDYGFIKHLMKWDEITKLQDTLNTDCFSVSDEDQVFKTVYDDYKDYCDTWKLDYEADNRENKEYLKR